MLDFWDDLNESERSAFVEQLSSIDFDLFHSVQEQAACEPLGSIAPAQTYKADSTCKEAGEQSIRNGELGVLTLAGGQGSRLGWSGPKGTFPATPITGKSLFQVIAEQIVYASQKYGVEIPWYIMTSQENDEVTKSFLLDNNCFGLDRTSIFVFKQDQVPVSDENGKMLLAKKGRVAVSPDGSGGVLNALKKSGALEEMEARGVIHLSYVQIDNPLVHVIDPVFIGMHIRDDSSKEVTSKFVKKTLPEEKVGVFCSVDGNLRIVEYSELPQDLAEERNEDGELRFQAGSIAIHMMSTAFLKTAESALSWHLAHKKVPFIHAETGELVLPESPNAYKYERFVFDILPLTKQPIVVETCREEEFAPIKNATGSDSAETSSVLQLNRSATWLRNNKVEVSEHAKVEVSPLTASSSEDLQGVELPSVVTDGESLVV